jgi:hypothetical protein
MPIDDDVLDEIATVAATLTPAKIAALKAKTDARLASFEAGQTTIDALDAETLTYTSGQAALDASVVAAASSASSKVTAIANLQAQVTALQEEIAEGGPPADAADVAERDQVVALAAEVGVTIP